MFLRFATRLWGVCDFPNFMLVSCAVFPCFTARIFQTSQLATKSLLCWLHSSPLGCLKSLRLHGYHTFLAPWRPRSPDATRRCHRWPFCRRWTPAKFFCTSWIHLRRGVKDPWDEKRSLHLRTQRAWVVYNVPKVLGDIYIYTLYVELMLII